MVPSMYVCFAGFKLETYANRVLQAFEKRAHCIALMKYYFIIRNMPYDESVVSHLDDDRIEKIVNRARSMRKLTYDYLMPCLEENVKESEADYQECMNKLIFDSSVLNSSQFSTFTELNLPLSSVMVKLRDSKWGAISTQQFKQHVTLRAYETDGYFSSVEAIKALQGAVAENEKILAYDIFSLTFEKSQKLEKFDRMFQEQITRAVRTIKQEWLQNAMTFRYCVASTE